MPPWIFFFVPDRSKIGKTCQRKKNIIRLELSAHYEDDDIRIELDAGKTISEKKNSLCCHTRFDPDLGRILNRQSFLKKTLYHITIITKYITNNNSIMMSS